MPSKPKDQDQTQDLIAEQKLFEDCRRTTRQLLKVLQEETDILKRFAGEELLALLPRKEILVRELEERLNLLPSYKGRRSPEHIDFRKSLLEIQKINRSNQIFIQCSLDYWDDLLKLFRPASYGPSQEEGSRSHPSVPKGLSFSKEV